MIYLIIYLVLAFFWGCYSIYRIRQFGILGKKLSNQIQTFLINFTIFPYCLYYAIRYKKL